MKQFSAILIAVPMLILGGCSTGKIQSRNLASSDCDPYNPAPENTACWPAIDNYDVVTTEKKSQRMQASYSVYIGEGVDCSDNKPVYLQKVKLAPSNSDPGTYTDAGENGNMSQTVTMSADLCKQLNEDLASRTAFDQFSAGGGSHLQRIKIAFYYLEEKVPLFFNPKTDGLKGKAILIGYNRKDGSLVGRTHY